MTVCLLMVAVETLASLPLAGVALDNDFAVFSNSNGSGFALVGSDLHNASFPSYKVPLSVRMDPDEAAAIVAGELSWLI